VSQACQAAIKGYHHLTRHTAVADGYQSITGKCFYRTVSHAHLSDSDYGLVAYQWFNPAWATVLTVGRVMSCNPMVAQTPLFALFDKPLPPAVFVAKAKVLSKGLSWLKLSDSKQEVQDALHTLVSPLPKTIDPSTPPPPFINDALFNFKGKAWVQGLLYAVNQPAHSYNQATANQP
jgi:putative component of membrane protein insertase Oxa1/YidC/SpoIIIJ protein YidD